MKPFEPLVSVWHGNCTLQGWGRSVAKSNQASAEMVLRDLEKPFLGQVSPTMAPGRKETAMKSHLDEPPSEGAVTLSAFELRSGMSIHIEGELYKAVSADYHAGGGKMGGVAHAKRRNNNPRRGRNRRLRGAGQEEIATFSLPQPSCC